MESEKMLKCAFYVVVVTLLVKTEAGSSVSQCYVGTPENRTFTECMPQQPIRSKRQSEITRPMVGNDTFEPKAVTVPVSTPEPSANATPAGDLQNSTLIPNLQSSTRITKLPNSTETKNLSKAAEESTSPASAATPHSPTPCLTLVARNASLAGKGIFYDCDYGGLCDGAESRELLNITYRGLPMVARCCQGVGCDSDHNRTLPDATKTLKCFQGANETAAECPSSGWVCVNSTRTSNEVTNFSAVAYSCQPLNDSVCNGSSVPKCVKHVTPAGQQVTSCCCSTDHCNAPTPTAQVTVDAAIFDSFDSVKWIVYGWVMVVSACILAGTTALIFKWRRRRLEDDDSVCIISNPRFQRLAANFTAGDTDDVKMLLADPEC